MKTVNGKQSESPNPIQEQLMKDHSTLLQSNKTLLQKILQEQKNPQKIIEPVISEVMKPYVAEINQIRKIYDEVKN